MPEPLLFFVSLLGLLFLSLLVFCCLSTKKDDSGTVQENGDIKNVKDGNMVMMAAKKDVSGTVQEKRDIENVKDGNMVMMTGLGGHISPPNLEGGAAGCGDIGISNDTGIRGCCCGGCNSGGCGGCGGCGG